MNSSLIKTLDTIIYFKKILPQGILISLQNRLRLSLTVTYRIFMHQVRAKSTKEPKSCLNVHSASSTEPLFPLIQYLDNLQTH